MINIFCMEFYDEHFCCMEVNPGTLSSTGQSDQKCRSKAPFFFSISELISDLIEVDQFQSLGHFWSK